MKMMNRCKRLCVITTLPWLILTGCAQSPANQNTAYDAPYSGNPTGDAESARVHTELGAEYLRLRQYDVALEEFNTAIQRSSTYGLAHNGLGLVYSALGETAKADAAFQRSIQLQPSSSESHNNYGRFLCDQGKFAAADKEFMLAVKNPLYKTPQIAFYNAGVCAIRNQQKGQAEAYFGRALSIDPLAHASAYQLASLQFSRGDAAQAWNTLQNAVSVAPSPESLALAVRITQQLQMSDDSQYYKVQLHKLFPNSNESKQLLKNE